MHVVVNGIRTRFDLSHAQQVAMTEQSDKQGFLSPACSDAVAAALVRRGVAKRWPGGRVRLNTVGRSLRGRLRAARHREQEGQ